MTLAATQLQFGAQNHHLHKEKKHHKYINTMLNFQVSMRIRKQLLSFIIFLLHLGALNVLSIQVLGPISWSFLLGIALMTIRNEGMIMVLLLVGELTGHIGGLDKGAEVSGHGTFSEHLACRLLLIADNTCPLVVLTALLSLLHLPFTNNIYQQIQVQNRYMDRRMVAMYRSKV